MESAFRFVPAEWHSSRKPWNEISLDIEREALSAAEHCETIDCLERLETKARWRQGEAI